MDNELENFDHLDIKQKFIKTLSNSFDVHTEGDKIIVFGDNANIKISMFFTSEGVCFVKNIEVKDNSEYYEIKNILRKILEFANQYNIFVQMMPKAIHHFLDITPSLVMANNWYSNSKSNIRKLKFVIDGSVNEAISAYAIELTAENDQEGVVLARAYFIPTKDKDTLLCIDYYKEDVAKNDGSGLLARLFRYVSKTLEKEIVFEKEDDMKVLKTKTAQIMPVQPINPNVTQITTLNNQIKGLMAKMQDVQKRQEQLNREKTSLESQLSQAQLKLSNLSRQQNTQPIPNPTIRPVT